MKKRVVLLFVLCSLMVGVLSAQAQTVPPQRHFPDGCTPVIDAAKVPVLPPNAAFKAADVAAICLPEVDLPICDDMEIYRRRNDPQRMPTEEEMNAAPVCKSRGYILKNTEGREGFGPSPAFSDRPDPQATLAPEEASVKAGHLTQSRD
jgi:hypothetical protein